MSRIFLMSAGAAMGVMVFAGCDPYLPSPGISISIDQPTAGASDIPIDFTSTVTIDGTFSLVDPGCDPTAFHIDADHGILVPEWDPYTCASVDANGEPLQTEGHIQYFVDGIFMALSTTPDVHVDLTPKLEYAYYDYVYDDAGEPVDVSGDGTLDDDYFHYCSFYLPADNLGYAEAYYDTFSRATMEQVYGVPMLDLDAYGVDGTVQPAARQPEGLLDYFGYGFYYENFDYYGTNGSGYDGSTDLHTFYAELHANNFSAIYGVNRPLIVTGGFDVSDMPADWCGQPYWFGVGNPYYL
jgi:hypothetical protein